MADSLSMVVSRAVNRLQPRRVDANVPDAGLPISDMFMEVDDAWLAEHPNVSDVYGWRLEFQFIDNESGFVETSAPMYSDLDVIGRAEPYRTFAGTGVREMTFVLQFAAQGLGVPGEQISPTVARDIINEEVIQPVRFLDAMKYPVEDTEVQISYAPPPVYLQLGELFQARCVVQNAVATWRYPVDPISKLPMYADVPVTFAVVRRVPSNPLVMGGPVSGVFQ